MKGDFMKTDCCEKEVNRNNIVIVEATYLDGSVERENIIFCKECYLNSSVFKLVN
jgi:hypothetical protein